MYKLNILGDFILALRRADLIYAVRFIDIFCHFINYVVKRYDRMPFIDQPKRVFLSKNLFDQFQANI